MTKLEKQVEKLKKRCEKEWKIFLKKPAECPACGETKWRQTEYTVTMYRIAQLSDDVATDLLTLPIPGMATCMSCGETACSGEEREVDIHRSEE